MAAVLFVISLYLPINTEIHLLCGHFPHWLSKTCSTCQCSQGKSGKRLPGHPSLLQIEDLFEEMESRSETTATCTAALFNLFCCIITSPQNLFSVVSILTLSPYFLAPSFYFCPVPHSLLYPLLFCCLFLFSLYFPIVLVMKISACVWSRTIWDAYGHGNIFL